jgi:Flp pilus assembly secretin CpaC
MGCHGMNRRIKYLLLIALAVCALSAPLGLGAEENTDPASATKPPDPIITRSKTIEARTGEKWRVRMGSKILDVAVTRPEVADAFISKPAELLLSANSPGIGKIIAHLENGERIALKIRVYVADPERFVAELKQKIGHIQGINIEIVKGKILVDGRVLYLKDMDAIESAVSDNPSIINLTSLSSRNARILAREIQRELRESGIYGVTVEVRNNRVTLVGSLRTALLAAKAEKIASGYTHSFDSLLRVGQDSGPEKDDRP